MAALSGAPTCGVARRYIAGALEEIRHLRQSLCKRSRTHVITGIASHHNCIQGCGLFKNPVQRSMHAHVQYAKQLVALQMQAMAEGLLHLFCIAGRAKRTNCVCIGIDMCVCVSLWGTSISAHLTAAAVRDCRLGTGECPQCNA